MSDRQVLVVGYRPQVATRLHELGIPFIYAAAKKEQPLTAAQVIDKLGLPVVVKPLMTPVRIVSNRNQRAKVSAF